MWADYLGTKLWNWQGILGYYRASETNPKAADDDKDKPLYGSSGPIAVAPLDHPSHHPDGAAHRVTHAFVAAARALGHQPSDFGQGTEGVGVNNVNAFDGKRCGAAYYLRSAGLWDALSGGGGGGGGGSGSSSSSSEGEGEGEGNGQTVDAPAQDSATTANGALEVMLNSQAMRIVFDEDKRAIGVEVRQRRRNKGGSKEDKEGNTSRRILVKARREIILCGGAVSSPTLLMLSGVGPADHLRDLAIPVVADLPGVGAHLKDHLHVPVCFRVRGGVRPHSHSNICEGSLFLRTDKDKDKDNNNNNSNSNNNKKQDATDVRPDLQFHVGTIFFQPDGFSPEGEGFTLTPSLIHPESTGTIRLADADPDNKPVISANYLSDPEGKDLALLVEGVRRARRLGARMIDELGADAGAAASGSSGSSGGGGGDGEENEPFRGLAGAEEYPGPGVNTDAEIEAYVRRYVGTMYHPACTCRMGPDGDPSAVLDPLLRVRGGVAGLRVCDASAMPEIVGANTNATCVALGEKGADLVATHWLERAALLGEKRARLAMLREQLEGVKAMAGSEAAAAAKVLTARLDWAEAELRRGQ